MSGFIEFCSGPFEGRKTEVFDGDLIGSDSACRVRLPEAAPARVARLRCDEQGYWIELLIPGTLTLPGARAGELWLNHGDRLRIEAVQIELVFSMVETSAPGEGGPRPFRHVDTSVPTTRAMITGDLPVKLPPGALMHVPATRVDLASLPPLSHPAQPAENGHQSRGHAEDTPENWDSAGHQSPRAQVRPTLSGGRTRLRLRVWTQAALVGGAVATLFTLALGTTLGAAMRDSGAGSARLALHGPEGTRVTLSFEPETGPFAQAGARLSLEVAADTEVSGLPSGKPIELTATRPGFRPHQQMLILTGGERREHTFELQHESDGGSAGPGPAGDLAALSVGAGADNSSSRRVDGNSNGSPVAGGTISASRQSRASPPDGQQGRLNHGAGGRGGRSGGEIGAPAGGAGRAGAGDPPPERGSSAAAVSMRAEEPDDRGDKAHRSVELGAHEVPVDISSNLLGTELKVGSRKRVSLPYRRTLPAGEHRFAVYDPEREVWLTFNATVPPDRLRMVFNLKGRSVAINGQIFPLVGQ